MKHSWNAPLFLTARMTHQQAVDLIHKVTFGDSGFGKKIPMTITVMKDGKVTLSQVGALPGPKARSMAELIYGRGNVEYVNGGIKRSGHHSEERGANASSDTNGIKQYTSHYACDNCATRQAEKGIINMTGNAKDNGGNVTRKSTFEAESSGR